MRKTDAKELLGSTDVQDPTDFPPASTAPGLRALDSALRCNICQELYEAPVVLTCGHCFCSLVRVKVPIRFPTLSQSLPLAVCTHPTRREANMPNMLERNHHQQLQSKSGDGRSRRSMERRKARPQALCDDHGRIV